MKKSILIISILVIVGFIFLVVPSYGTTKGITDSTKLTDKKLAIAYAKTNYPKCKIKFITLTSDKDWEKILKRKGKNIVYIEKCITKSSGKKYGYTIKGHYYVAYNKKVKKNKKVTSYFIWNPNTNYEDDVVAAVDNKMIR